MGERSQGKKYDQTSRDFGGINTQSSRHAIGDDEFSWLENMMPIGHGNLVAIPAPTDTGASVSGTCYYMKSANIANVNYMFMFTTDGAAYQINLSTYVLTVVATAGTFSGVSTQIDQWKNDRILIIDLSFGYWDWDGVTLTHNTVSSAPTAGTCIAVYSGRVWVANNRTIQFSAPDSYVDFTTASLGGSFIMEDSTLHSSVMQLLSANGFLYIIGIDSINVVSDVRVSTTPAVTLFSNLNLVTTAGTASPGSVVAYYRSIWMATPYGFYGVTGSTAQKGSDNLDGIFPFIHSVTGFSAGVVVINKILCLAFMFNYADPLSSARTIIAVFFNKKWFIASQGNSLTQCAGATVDGTQNLYATNGNKLFKLFSDVNSQISQTFSSKLWDMGDQLSDKQVLKVGVETILPAVSGTISVTVDSELSSSTASLAGSSSVNWINNSSQTIHWINNSSSIVSWLAFGYIWFRGDVSNFGKYAGITVSSSVPQLNILAEQLQYELRARW